MRNHRYAIAVTPYARIKRGAWNGFPTGPLAEGDVRDFNFHGIHGDVDLVSGAADYDAPQRRERIFIVGFRADLDIEWSFPEPTHSQDALVWSQWRSIPCSIVLMSLKGYARYRELGKLPLSMELNILEAGIFE